MELRHLQAFVAVAEELHFGRAAERLKWSPSPVSRTVAELERELRAPLFVRSHHRVALTPAAEALLPDAQQLLVGWAGFVARGRSLAGPGVPLRVRVGSPTTAPSGVVDGVAAVLRDLHPGLAVDVEFAPTSGLLEALRRGELDLTVAYLPLDDPGFGVRAVARCPVGLVMTEQHELAGRPEVTLADLKGLRVLTLDPALQPAKMSRNVTWLRGAGAVVEQMPDADLVRLAQLVRHGRGVTLTTMLGPAAHVFAQPGLVIVPMRDEGDVFAELGIVWRAGSTCAAWLQPLLEHDALVPPGAMLSPRS